MLLILVASPDAKSRAGKRGIKYMVENLNKLKGKIVENNYTYKALSKAMGITEMTLRRKMNNQNAEFYLEESKKLKDLLKLTDKEYLEIFIG